MSLTLELPPEVETRLRDEASRHGMATEAFVYDLITRRLQSKARQKNGVLSVPSTRLTAAEQELLNAANAELSPEFWQRYRYLQVRVTQGISAQEQEELIGLSQQSEAWNLRRLTLLQGMAHQRSLTLRQLIQRFKLQHHPEA